MLQEHYWLLQHLTSKLRENVHVLWYTCLALLNFKNTSMNTCLYGELSVMVYPMKGEASNRDALLFRVGMYVCISTDCAMQFYSCVCISATLAQYNPMRAYVCPSRLCNYCTIQWPKCALDDYDPGLLPGLYLMEEHNHKCFKSPPRSLRIAYDFSDAMKTHLNAECVAL